MDEEDNINYNRIEKAIEFIRDNHKQQPTLENIANEMGLSPFHFQRIFTNWAGVSPKNFMQFISLQHAKNILKTGETTLFDAAFELGLSGTSRLHDLFIKIEGMTPGEYKNGGKNLEINYAFYESPFGKLILASTKKGICCMEFCSSKEIAKQNLLKKFPNANFMEKQVEMQKKALAIFKGDWTNPQEIKLHLNGTEFQLKVWETLLKIPKGGLTTYGTIAKKIEKPNASRAVGTAIGKNPIAFLIPCHRVIQSSGKLGGYMWGEVRKTAIIGWESSEIRK